MALIKPGSENAIQAAYFEWAAYASAKYPELQLLFAIPNGANKTPAERIVFKATGLKSGVPDVFLPVPRGGYHGLFIEFKTEKGKVSDTQKQWLADLAVQGYHVVVCRDMSEAVELTVEYLKFVDGYTMTGSYLETEAPADDLVWFSLADK